MQRHCAPADTYWSLSRTPLISLVYSLPLVLAYEGACCSWAAARRETGRMCGCGSCYDGLDDVFARRILLPALMILASSAWRQRGSRPAGG